MPGACKLLEMIWGTGIGFGGSLALRPHPRPFGHPLPIHGEWEAWRILASPQRELGGDWRGREAGWFPQWLSRCCVGGRHPPRLATGACQGTIGFCLWRAVRGSARVLGRTDDRGFTTKTRRTRRGRQNGLGEPGRGRLAWVWYRRD